jgi:hypothetical protein
MTKVIQELDRNLVRNHSNLNQFPFLIITGANYAYIDSVLNWIRHIELLHYKRYIILCYDSKIFNIVGAEHGVEISLPSNTDAFISVNRFQMKQNISTNKVSTINHNQSYGHENSGRDRERRNALQRKLTATTLTTNSSEQMSVRLQLRQTDSRTRLWLYKKLLKSENKFNAMMLFKHAAVYESIKLNIPTVWSDVDSVWLKSCAINYLKSQVFVPNLLAFPPQAEKSEQINQNGHHTRHKFVHLRSATSQG